MNGAKIKSRALQREATLTELCQEVAAVKRLMILALVRGGIKQKDVAAALGKGESWISELFPPGLLQRRNGND